MTVTHPAPRHRAEDLPTYPPVPASWAVGQYPLPPVLPAPAVRLMPTADTKWGELGSINLDPSRLADAGKLRHPAHASGSGDALVMRFTETDNPAKPGPVFITIGRIPEGEGALQYLLQPNLTLR